MKTKMNPNRNEQGFSVIELLIVMGITAVLVGAAIFTFTKQEKVIRVEQAAAEIRAAGRNGINELAKELRRAGYGMPRGHGLYSVGTNYVYWWANIDNATTAVTNDVSSGDTSIDVQDANLLATDTGGFGYLMLRAVNKTDLWNMVRFNTAAAGGTKVNLSMYPNQAFSAGTETVQLSKMHYLRLTHDTTNNIIYFYDDAKAAVPLIHNVKSVTFTYFDNAGNSITAPLTNTGWTSSVSNTTGSNNIHNIRRIGIALVMEDPNGFAKDITLQTDINLRNMGS